MQPLRKLVSVRVYLLSLFEAALTVACYVGALYLVNPLEAPVYLEYEDGTARIALVALTFLIASYVFDFYDHEYTRSRLVLALQVSRLIGIILLVQAGLAFFSPEFVLPQMVVLAGSSLTLIVLVLWHLFFRPRVWNAFGAQQVLFVGYNSASSRLARKFQTQPVLGMQVIGFAVEPDAPVPPGPVLGTSDDLNRIIKEIRPDRIIVGDTKSDTRLLRILFNLKASGATVETAGQAHETFFGRVYSLGLEPYSVIFRNELAARPTSLAFQSVYTNLLGLAAIVLVLPLLVITGILLRLTGAPRVLAKVPCAGLHGVPFNMYRFACEGPVGRFLCRFKLDGLPQILNLVRGEMSLIGPRPELIHFDAQLSSLIPFYRQKHHVKPGLMGWSQLHCDSYPYEDTLERLEYDLYYIKHISIVLDAYILLRALKWLLADREAAVPFTGSVQAPSDSF